MIIDQQQQDYAQHVCIEEQTAEKTIGNFAFCKKDYTYLYLSVLSRNKTAIMNDIINSK